MSLIEPLGYSVIRIGKIGVEVIAAVKQIIVGEGRVSAQAISGKKQLIRWKVKHVVVIHAIAIRWLTIAEVVLRIHGEEEVAAAGHPFIPHLDAGIVKKIIGDVQVDGFAVAIGRFATDFRHAAADAIPGIFKEGYTVEAALRRGVVDEHTAEVSVVSQSL